MDFSMTNAVAAGLGKRTGNECTRSVLSMRLAATMHCYISTKFRRLRIVCGPQAHKPYSKLPGCRCSQLGMDFDVQ